ncbi:MAG TPA: hypothetical protein VD963_11105 [Phycisphaerales bacterium]|nr:hypothetical protein [Phycisphaerales bacterium]
MNTNDVRKLLGATVAARDRAEAVIQGLIQAKAECERALAEAKREDTLKKVTGRSAMENAVTQARKVVDSLDRAIDQLRADLAREGGIEGDMIAAGSHGTDN